MSEVYELYVKTNFSAAHRLKGYPGDCAQVHGHNWNIEVFVKCKKLNEIGLGIDFREIKQVTQDVLRDLDHVNLSELPMFQDVNPSSENIAKFLYKELSRAINSDGVNISKVKVSETHNAGSFYWEE